MAFYNNEVARLTKSLYPHDDLTKHIIQSKLYIDKHFSENINLDKIAAKAHASKFHFIRLFKKIYGKTPHQYLTFVRIERAKEFLKSDMAVHHVCYSVGFESISSFTDLFKKMVGYSPSVFQVQQTRMKSEIHKMPLKFVPNCFAEKLAI